MCGTSRKYHKFDHPCTGKTELLTKVSFCCYSVPLKPSHLTKQDFTAICTSPHAPHHMHLTICTSPHAPHHMHLTTCTSPHAPHHIHLTTCTSPHAPHHMHLTICTSPYAPHHMHLTIRLHACSVMDCNIS